MLRSVAVSAPGKAILIGEHAVVYRRPAVVAALDLRLLVRLEPAAAGVAIDLPQLGFQRRLDPESVLAYARRRRAAWSRYAERPGAETFAAVRGEDASHLVQVALGEAADALGLERLPPLALEVRSQIPLGSGFGSSAAAAVALLQAFFSALGAQVERARLERLAAEVERRQHGNPSGIDTATVLHGGLWWARRRADGVERRPLAPRAEALAGFRLFDSGAPAEDTGSVVEAVRERRERDPAAVDRSFDAIAAATGRFAEALERGASGELVDALRAAQRELEAIGVVPAPVRELVAAVEAAGGAAKISGAGSLAGPGAGSLLVYHPQPAKLDEIAALAALDRFPVRLGAEGVRDEATPA